MIVAATGHRPEKLGGYSDEVFGRLIRLAEAFLARTRPETTISGVALGWDQAFATAAADMGIPLIAAVPFEGQERRWPDESQRRYRLLTDRAWQVEIVSEYPGAAAMDLRNRWMVDCADRVVALWDGSWGGTFNCVKYAEKRHVPVENLWRHWANDLTGVLA